MHKKMLLGASALSLALVAGCGGSSTPIVAPTVTRVLVGYVYVTKNDGGTYTGPSAFILPVNNLKVLDPTPNTPDSGDEIPLDKPTSGVVSVTIDGTLTRALSTLDFDMSVSNEIICLAKGQPNGTVDVEVVGGSPLMNGAVTKALSLPVVNLGPTAGNNTVLAMQSPSTPTYTPGLPDEVRTRLQTTKGVGGIAAIGPMMTPADLMASNGTGLGTGFMAGQVYNLAAAVLDKNGIVITGASTTIASSDITRVSVAGTQLTAVAGTGVTSGDVQITVGVVGSTLVSEIFHGMFSQGTATAITVAPPGPTNLLWAAAGVEATVSLTATVRNQVGAPVPGATLNWTSNKETAAGSNIWNTGTFTSLTAVFTPNTGTTANDGTLGTVVTAPTSTGALAPGNPAKGLATMTAKVGTTTGTAQINITRPLGSITIAGPNGLDVNTLSGDPNAIPLPANTIRVTGAADIDGDTVTSPTVVWNIVNTVNGGVMVGNTGDKSLRSESLATIAANGRVTAGAVAGQAVVTATGGGVTSNALTIDIFGKPSKIIYTPDTNLTGGYAGAAGTTQAFDVTFIDTFGHDNTAQVSGLVTQSGISSSAAGQITNGGANVKHFVLTFGTSAGTFTITATSGSWTGTHGGTATDFSGLFRTGTVN